jgi:hypothetical protein
MLPERDELFEALYQQIRTNWIQNRKPGRWPTADKNWVLRVAPEFTQDPNHRLEKQLQKQIARCLENEGWGNDVPTASGLVDAWGRQMNIDLAHRIDSSFELIELKLGSNTPYDAALQILRYGALYMLYRTEPELACRFRSHSIMSAPRILLEVLAPSRYYLQEKCDLRLLETQLDRQVAAFARARAVALELSFHFTAFPSDFTYQPGMHCDLIRDAVKRRRRLHETVQIKGSNGQQIRSFTDWDKYALPPARRQRQWKEGRSEFELGRVWTANGEPALPPLLSQLLESNEQTKGIVVSTGTTQHETILPFSTRGPRCHDLALRGERDGRPVTICIEAKADESFGGTVSEELERARQRSKDTRFPKRLDWLTRSLLGLPSFLDEARFVLSDRVSTLPYQLLSGIGGTLLEAQLQQATMAVFVVHEFRTPATDDTKLEANANALDGFLRLLDRRNQSAGQNVQLVLGHLIGPISVIGCPADSVAKMPCDIPLFIGKIRTDRLGEGRQYRK